VSVIKSPAHADQSCRELALSLENAPQQAVSVSPVTIWRYQVALDCNGPRGRQVSQRHGPAPDTEWVAGPNKLWDWDMTYLCSGEPGVYWYLYSLLDHFSRKAVAWLVDERLSSELAQTLWDQGLVNEARLDVPRAEWPKSLSDRAPKCARNRPASTSRSSACRSSLAGRASPTTRYAARIEAHFGTIKSQPVYPVLLQRGLGGGDLLHRLLRLVQRPTSADHRAHAHPQPGPHRPSRRPTRGPPDPPDYGARQPAGRRPHALYAGGAYRPTLTRCLPMPGLLLGGTRTGSAKHATPLA